MVRAQKESTTQLRASNFYEGNRHLVRYRSEDGITTYIVLDGKGKMAGIRMTKVPLEKRQKPMWSSDTNSILTTLKRQKKVNRIRIKKLQRMTSLYPLPKTRIFSEDKKEFADKGDKENSEGMLKEKDILHEEPRPPVLSKRHHETSMYAGSPLHAGDDSGIGIKTGKKIYNSGMNFLAKWVPDFVLKGMKLNNQGDVKYKIPIPNFKQDVEFGLRLNRERNVLSNDSEMIVMGIFTITFGGRRYKKANNLATNAGPFHRGIVKKHHAR